MRGVSGSRGSRRVADAVPQPAPGPERSLHDHPSRADARRRGWLGALLVAALSLLGAAAGLLGAAAVSASGDRGVVEALAALLTGTSPEGGVMGLLGCWGFVAAGWLIGGWVGIAILTARRPGVACPRCGTRNAPAASCCSACDLPLR